MGQRGMDTPGEKKDITAALNQNQERQAPPPKYQALNMNGDYVTENYKTVQDRQPALKGFCTQIHWTQKPA